MGRTVSQIGNGLCILVGIKAGDTKADAEEMCKKILALKLWDDAKGKRWNANVVKMGYELLFVSNFTLYNRIKKNKPQFREAMAPAEAKEFYESFLNMVRQQYAPEKVKDGEFGAYMSVSIENDGPVTIDLQSASGVAAPPSSTAAATKPAPTKRCNQAKPANPRAKRGPRGTPSGILSDID